MSSCGWGEAGGAVGQSSSGVTSDPPHGMRTGCFVVSETVLRSLGEKSSQQELPELAGQNCLDCKAKKRRACL